LLHNLKVCKKFYDTGPGSIRKKKVLKDWHLVGLDDVAADLPVHPGGLERPTRALFKGSITFTLSFSYLCFFPFSLLYIFLQLLFWLFLRSLSPFHSFSFPPSSNSVFLPNSLFTIQLIKVASLSHPVTFILVIQNPLA